MSDDLECWTDLDIDYQHGEPLTVVAHTAKVQWPTKITTGCTCGWQAEPFRSNKPTWQQWVEHKVQAS